ncbi:alpha/beta fold hydrolase [Humibacter ginsenosidimutans]|uniref:Lysophospholipase n=1 Tax=Humibacter ginsenosidimutans TaxID=2599293 RepID=A0A5B8M4S8_9MICO|nr:alpha/beta fold hydrolase [Humibacter ginsenosidimutans]QDZ15728.1 lysophospholipase [Humibacter ginsenosidimutans]
MPTFDDEQGVTVTYYVWRVGHPRAVIHLVHGIGEYATRYEPLVSVLNENGYSVYAADQRGHGQTGLDQWNGDRSKLGRLGPGGLRAAVEDIRQLNGIIRAENPGVPLVLLGHSMGSLTSQMLVNDHADELDALVLTGTAYRTPLHMEAGDLNKHHKQLGTTGYEWLSRDPQVAADFAVDPLTFDAKVLKLFGVADGLRLYGRPARGIHDLPLLVMIGEEDSLGGPKSARMLVAAYEHRAGFTDTTLEIYPGARHEVFNETNRDEVMRDLVLWLDARFPQRV